MKLILSLALTVSLLGAAAPHAVADVEPCSRPEHFTSARRWFSTGGSPVGNTSAGGLAAWAGWRDAPPTGSLSDGAGSTWVYSGEQQLVTKDNDPVAAFTAEGVFEGCLDTIALDVFLLLSRQQAEQQLQLADAFVTPLLAIDGRGVFRMNGGVEIEAEIVAAQPPVARLRLAFTNIADAMRRLPDAFAPIDGPHRVHVKFGSELVGMEHTVIGFDAVEVPSGAHLNAVSLEGYHVLDVVQDAHYGKPVAADAGTDECERSPNPVETGECPGVRPGGYVHVEGQGGCTFNYLFHSTGADGRLRRFIGTAGHCAIASSATDVTWAAGAGPRAFDGSGADIGAVVYATRGAWRDFALIELEPEVLANPQMCHYGGPIGIDEGLRQGPVTVVHSGNGMVIGDVVPGRTGVATDWSDPDELAFTSPIIFGDSGSGVNTEDGYAAGVASSLRTLQNGRGHVRATRLKPQLEDAERALGLDLELQTAPLL